MNPSDYQVLTSGLPMRSRCLMFALFAMGAEPGAPVSLSLAQVASAMGAGTTTAHSAILEAVGAGWLIRRKPEPYKFGRGHKYEYEPVLKAKIGGTFVSRGTLTVKGERVAALAQPHSPLGGWT